MERHILRLKKLCRMCGRNLGKKQSYNKTAGTVSGLLLDFYRVNTKEESSEVFPQTICRKCYDDVKRLRDMPVAAAQALRNNPGDLPPLHQFIAHSDLCTTCTPKKKGRKRELAPEEEPQAKRSRDDEHKPSTSMSSVEQATRKLFIPVAPQETVNAIETERFSSRLVDSFKCGLCKKVHNNQVRTKCCSNLFCVKCLKEHAQFNGTCPLCKTVLYEGEQLSVVELAEEDLRSRAILKATCRYKFKGCQSLLPVEEAIAHDGACPMRATPRLMWPDQSRPVRPKMPLTECAVKTGKQRTKELKEKINAFCDDHNEDRLTTQFFLLVHELKRAGDVRAATVEALFYNKPLALSTDECIAMRVENLQSKTQYARQYNFLKDKTVHLLKPPDRLNNREHDFMPPTTRYTIQRPVAPSNPEYYHTPRKPKSTSSQPGDFVVTPKLSDTTEPIDVMESFPQDFPEIARPNCEGVRWSYPDALAKTLEELDEIVSTELLKLGMDPTDPSLQFHAKVKDGCDGMGDISVYRQKTDVTLPDKAFRFCFCVINIEVEAADGTLHRLYTCPNPNSVRTNRPLLEAIGDENNRLTCIIFLEPIEAERDAMKGNWLNVKVGDINRRFMCQFYTSMIDEKLDRKAGGQEGSGSGFMCTMCDATTETAKSAVGTHSITRTFEETAKLAENVITNPDKLSKAQMKQVSKGVKQQPIMRTDAAQKGYDATHADINMGLFFKKVIVREIANVRTWDVRRDVKEQIEEAESNFDTFMTSVMGLVPKLMMPGNYARALFDQSKEELVLQLIQNEDRRELVRKALGHFRFLRKMYRAKNPKDEYPEDIPRIEVVALELGLLFIEHFSYVHWPNYLHKIIEHTKELIQTAGTIGGLSGEGIEAGNKLFRYMRMNLSRKGKVSEGLRDVLWLHWLYSSPKLFKVGETTSQQQRCSRCLEVGHKRPTCPAVLE